MQKKVIYAKCNGGPDGKHGCLVGSWQVAFTFTPIQALPTCLSNKINPSLLVKREAREVKLDTPFSFVVYLGMLHGKCQCVGELSPVILSSVQLLKVAKKKKKKKTVSSLLANYI